MNPLRVAVVGAGGRMGRMVLGQVLGTPGLALAAALDRPDSPHLGQDAGALAGLSPCGVPLGADLAAGVAGAQVAIEFSAPAVLMALCPAAAAHGCALVVGTTALDATPGVRQALGDAARRVPVVESANMSLGVNLLLGLLGKVAAALPHFDLDIIEVHHNQKKDAPSGTALAMARALRQGRGGDAAIGLHSLRGGDVVGEHTACFFGPGERIEITHRATSREIFARGAVRAAQWAVGRVPGAYDMQDVLGLRG